jgi:hypothetical protein
MMFFRPEPDGAEFSVPSLLTSKWPRNHYGKITELSFTVSVYSVCFRGN